ncbi:MAG: hypothetical protein WA961_04045 [Rhodanobacter sp.]
MRLIAAFACLGSIDAMTQPPTQSLQQLHKHEALVPVATSSVTHASPATAKQHVALSDAMLHVVAGQPPLQASATTTRPAAALSPVAAQAAQKFHLDPLALSSGAVKAVSGSHAEVVKPDTLAEQARPGAVFVTRTSATATRVALSAPLRDALPAGAQTSAVRLGYVVSATAGAQATPVRLAALVADNTGLVLDAAHSAWRGGFSVALSNLDDPADRRVLNTPVNVAVTAAGASEVAPAPLSIADVGSWHAVRVTVPDFPGDLYRVSVSADPQDRGNAIDLKVVKPTIEVIAGNPQIAGWGIGQTTVTVRARGLITPDGYPVTLRNEHGSLDPTYVKLDAQGLATARLRSDSASSTSVSVADAGVVSQPATVVFSAPWLFLAAAVAGGLLGAFIRGKGRRRAWYALAIGVASAILMTLAYAVGIDWVSRALPAAHLATSGEAVVFVLGAIAALLGVGVLLPASGGEKGA